MDTYLTISEVSELLQLSTSTIYKYTCSKRIPFIKASNKHLLFSEKIIEEWLTEKTVNVDS